MKEKEFSDTSIRSEFAENILVKEVEQLAREKCLDRESVFSSLEQAFEKVARETYGMTNDIRVLIQRGTGNVVITRHRVVVEEVEDASREIAHQEVPHKQVGEEEIETLPMPPFNRVVVQNIKRSLTRSIQDIEQEIQFNEFKDRIGQLISGVVKRIEGGNLILDIGKAEGIIPRNELIPREVYRVNDRVKAYIYSVRREARGPQIFLSRKHPGFLARLFAQEVPEVYDGLIEIKAIARDPGSRAKVAIVSRDDRSFDAIGACVGVRGSRVNAISQELQGERIDIIHWSSDLPEFLVNALTPAEVVKVIIQNKRRVVIVVPDHQKSIAIGRRGQNVRLAHDLTGLEIEIATETSEREQRGLLREERTASFIKNLDIDEMMAHFLVSQGFESIRELSETPLAELASLEGFTEEVASELLERAREAVQDEETQLTEHFLQTGGDPRIVQLDFPVQALDCLAKANILSLQDLADLSVEELMGVLGTQSDLFTEDQWGQFIIGARSL
jgi:N utilization substance protein A